MQKQRSCQMRDLGYADTSVGSTCVQTAVSYRDVLNPKPILGLQGGEDLKKAAKCPLCYSWVAARELRLVQVQHVHAPQVRHGHQDCLLLHAYQELSHRNSTSNLVALSFGMYLVILRLLQSERLRSCTDAAQVHHKQLACRHCVNCDGSAAVWLPGPTVLYGCLQQYQGCKACLCHSISCVLRGRMTGCLQINDTVVFKLLKRPRDSIIPVEVPAMPSQTTASEQLKESKQQSNTAGSAWGSSKSQADQSSSTNSSSKDGKAHSKHRYCLYNPGPVVVTLCVGRDLALHSVLNSAAS